MVRDNTARSTNDDGGDENQSLEQRCLHNALGGHADSSISPAAAGYEV